MGLTVIINKDNCYVNTVTTARESYTCVLYYKPVIKFI